MRIDFFVKKRERNEEIKQYHMYRNCLVCTRRNRSEDKVIIVKIVKIVTMCTKRHFLIAII